MSPSLVTSSGGRQGRSCIKPRLVLKTINIVIEDEVSENDEVTLWDDAVDVHQQSSKSILKSTLFKSSMKGENEEVEKEATGGRQIMVNSGRRILTTSSSSEALCSISNPQPAQNPLLVCGNSQFLARNSSTAAIINDHPNYQLMPMPTGCTTASNSTSHLNLNKRPQAAVKRIFWGEEVPLMAVPALSSNTAQLHSLSSFKSMTKDNDVSYSKTAGHSLLITIKPVKGNGNGGAGSDENSASASHPLQRQPRRLLELSSLLNFFQLLVPEGVAKGDDNDSSSNNNLNYMNNQKVQKLLFSKAPYFLTLLDPSMPRLTNCGYYYRMRYAVYAMVSSASSAAALLFSVPQKFAEQQVGGHSWRSSNNSNNSKWLQPLGAPAQRASSHLVLHIGELHVYTIFPKEGGGGCGKKGKSGNKDTDRNSHYFPKWCQPGHIHYENVSFFANTAPLNDKELAAIQPATAGSINTVVLNFRRTLKLLNSVVINPVNGVVHMQEQQQSQPQLIEPDECCPQHSFKSTLLLEQLKYPKCSADFTNTDRTAQQFVRNQVEMFSRYQAHYSSDALNGAIAAADLSNRIQESLMKFNSAVEKKLLPVTLTVNNNGNGNKETRNEVDWSTVTDFLSKLHWLRNQAAKSKRIRSKSAADKC